MLTYVYISSTPNTISVPFQKDDDLLPMSHHSSPPYRYFLFMPNHAFQTSSAPVTHALSKCWPLNLMQARLPPPTVPEPRVAAGAARDMSTVELVGRCITQVNSGLGLRANRDSLNTRSRVEACRGWGSPSLALALGCAVIGPGEKTRGNKVNSHTTLLAEAREREHHVCRP